MSGSPSSRPSRPKTTLIVISCAVILQLACMVFFVGDILVSIFGIATINWQLHELIAIGAAVGLIIGTFLSVWILRRVLDRNRHIEGQLRAASGAFAELIEDRFTDWGLTPAERDVALFSIKGVAPQTIAEMRGVSEGTIKAQTNAIYRKAGVSGRSQLLSLFIEDLMDGPVKDIRAREAPVQIP